MKKIIATVCLLGFSQVAFSQTAMEKAEKQIAELVAPGSVVMPASTTAQPIAWKGSRWVEEIDVPIKPIAVIPVRLPLAALKEVKPRGAPEGTPLVSYREEAQVPKQPELPTKPLIKLPALDVHTPLAIPILARPSVDRASLGEPAFEASVGAAMKPFTPTRDRPVPFVPYNLPDPFEHVRYGQLRNPPEESATPPVVPLVRPTK